MVHVKICGLTRPSDIEAAVKCGAHYVGFVFFDKSPRHVSISQAVDLSLCVPPGVIKVGLFVDPEDVLLEAVLESVPLDMLQLHGSETPERVTHIKQGFGLPVMKALSVATSDDVIAIKAYENVADQILCDAKPPTDAAVPGGNGISFDWTLLAGYRSAKPLMLAGGLTAQNVAQAIAITGAQQVDVSSAVEYKPGLKSPEKINAFIQAVGVL